MTPVSPENDLGDGEVHYYNLDSEKDLEKEHDSQDSDLEERNITNSSKSKSNRSGYLSLADAAQSDGSKSMKETSDSSWAPDRVKAASLEDCLFFRGGKQEARCCRHSQGRRFT